MNRLGYNFWNSIGKSVTDPIKVANRIIELRMSVTDGLMALGACAALMTLLTWFMTNLMMSLLKSSILQAGISITDIPFQQIFDIMQSGLDHPFFLACLQFCVWLIHAYFMARLGRFFGGTGNLSGALSLFAWIEVFQIILLLLATIALIFVPLVSGFIIISSYFIYLYMMVYFTSILHGFKSIGRVLAVVVFSEFVFSVLLLLM